jgi:hypothetical protein
MVKLLQPCKDKAVLEYRLQYHVIISISQTAPSTFPCAPLIGSPDVALICRIEATPGAKPRVIGVCPGSIVGLSTTRST